MVGQPLKRYEDPKLITGAGSYVDDIVLPGMVHAFVVRSTHAHARITSIDPSSALAQPGIVAVLTGEQMAQAVNGMPTRDLGGDQAADHMAFPNQPVLATEAVCFVGEAVAIVVAETLAQARDAAEHVQISYQPLPPLLDPLEALEDASTPIHPELGTNVAMRTFRGAGDVEAALSKSDKIIRQRYEVQRLAPAPMETRGVLAEYRAGDDMLTIWGSTQEPHQLKEHVARLLKRPEDQVRVIAPDVGGGFGEKGVLFPEEVAIPYLAMLIGRPVKWIEDRQENMLAFHARGHTVDVEAGVSKDGTILGMKVRIVADLGAYFLLSTAAVPALAGHRIPGPYKTPAMHVDVLGVLTNKPPTGVYRGAGGPESAFCMERTIDLIAGELELDPAEIRPKNFIPPDSFPYTTPTGLTYDSGDYQKGLDRALELGQYSLWKERARQRKTGEPLIGVGIATVVKASGGAGYMREEDARVTIDPSGLITVYTGVSPHGQGNETAFAQIVAGQLGVSPTDVQVVHGDTALFPHGGGTEASRNTVVGGSALFLALQEARAKLATIAAHSLGCAREDIQFEDGMVFDGRDPQRKMTFSQVASAAFNEEMLPPGASPDLDFSTRYALPATPYASAAHVVVVEVSQDTGEAKILRYAGVHDCGNIINPKLVAGQVHGAIAQGVGQGLTEGITYSPDGQPVTGSLMDYAIPTAEEFGELLLDTIETPSPVTPMGVKGVGELPTVAAPAAVANAVMDALSSFGIRHIDTPLTSEKVWRAIQDAKGTSTKKGRR